MPTIPLGHGEEARLQGRPTIIMRLQPGLRWWYPAVLWELLLLWLSLIPVIRLLGKDEPDPEVASEARALLDRIDVARRTLEAKGSRIGVLAVRLADAQERVTKALANNAALEDEVVKLDARLEAARLALHKLAREHTYVDDKLATGLLEILNIVSKGADIFPLHGEPAWWSEASILAGATQGKSP